MSAYLYRWVDELLDIWRIYGIILEKSLEGYKRRNKRVVLKVLSDDTSAILIEVVRVFP
jgi:hypothetical protein